MRVIRIPVPRRPAVLTFSLFYLLASALATIHKAGPVLAAGAIVFNRLDVVTVHFVHSYYHREIRLSRRRRQNLFYLVNELVFGWMARRAEVWSYRGGAASMLVAVSRGTRVELEACFPEAAGRAIVITNGVDVDRFRPNGPVRREVRAELGISGDRPIAIFVGGDWERKGLRYAIAALKFARDWDLLVVGDGPTDRFGLVAIDNDAGGRVLFLGRRSDPHRLMAAADAFVMPTAYEAFSLALLEAASSGLPLLVSRVNGADEIVRDGLTGWFIERDGPAIARRLTQLSSTPDLGRRIGQNAREAVSTISWDHQVQVYATLLEAPPPTRADRLKSSHEPESPILRSQ